MPEHMLVQVELSWGRKWDDKEGYLKETKGEGIYVTVSEHWTNTSKGGYSFRGCPLGRTDGKEFPNEAVAIEYAIQDFLRYGKSEYLGKEKLQRFMIVVVETRDNRK